MKGKGHKQINPFGNIDLSKYIGQWVVICDNKVVAYDKDLTKIAKDIDRCKNIPTLINLPKTKTFINM